MNHIENKTGSSNEQSQEKLEVLEFEVLEVKDKFYELFEKIKKYGKIEINNENEKITITCEQNFIEIRKIFHDENKATFFAITYDNDVPLCKIKTKEKEMGMLEDPFENNSENNEDPFENNEEYIESEKAKDYLENINERLKQFEHERKVKRFTMQAEQDKQEIALLEKQINNLG